MHLAIFHDEFLSTFQIRLKDDVKNSVRIFDSICCATSAWDEVFSIPILFLITSRLITVSFGVFAIIQGFFIPVEWLVQLDSIFYTVFLTDFSMLGIVFTAVDMPTKEVIIVRLWDFCFNHNVLKDF